MSNDYSVVVAAVVAVVAILGLVMMYSGTTGAVSALNQIECLPGEVLSTMKCDETGACHSERHCIPSISTQTFG